MAVFKELIDTEKMEDPEKRVAGETVRLEKYNKKPKVKQTSVTAESYNRSMSIIGLICSIIAIAIVIALAYYGFKLFIG